MKWGLNFVGPIKHVGQFTGNKHIFVATNYSIKWVEITTFRTNIAVVTTKFLYEHNLIRFGCPVTLITYQGVHSSMIY
jgi:hypothetical protein